MNEKELELEEKISNYQNALISIYDYLKIVDRELIDNNINIDTLKLNEENLSEMFFRKLKAYQIDLNKDIGWDHLKPVYDIQLNRERRLKKILNEKEI